MKYHAFRDGDTTFCGRTDVSYFAGYHNAWGLVTCKRCLRHKPPDQPFVVSLPETTEPSNPHRCPNCGWQHDGWWDEDPSLVNITNYQTYLQDNEFTAHSWTEVHQCPDCATIWQFETADA